MRKKAYCIECDEMRPYHIVEKERVATVKDLTFKVKTKRAVCDKCGCDQLGPYEVMKENDITTFDEYRRLKGLLTSEDIKAIRKKRDMSQVELARFIKAGDKNIARYETGTIQDPVFDYLMRMVNDDKCYQTMVALQRNSSFKRLTKEQMASIVGNGPAPIIRKKKKVVVYIHGLHGSSKEADDYSYLSKEYDVLGLDYQDGNPWEVKDIIRSKFKKLTKGYKEVIVIANSIGAFYTYEYLSDFNIKQAFFISPIASMFKILFDYIFTGRVSEEELKEKKFITLDDGTTLSYDFYQEYSHNDYHGDWKVPTEILYGSMDRLVYIENIIDFLTAHPLSKLTIKEGSEHYFHTDEEKQFIKEWILRNIQK
ncbi:MAG: hypothetical protein J5666_05610 [Bacilli bacterium]|nr:hypothetical protein [Bacilli bacterium]